MLINSLFTLINSLKEEEKQELPVLANLAMLWGVRQEGKGIFHNIKPGFLERKIDRHYKRLCRVQEELNKLNRNTTMPEKNLSFEDYVFSQINFSPYKKITEEDFHLLIPEALTDFSNTFFRKNFFPGDLTETSPGMEEGNFYREKLTKLVENNYEKKDSHYILKTETPLILSLMRCLNTSLENSDLFGMYEIEKELTCLEKISREEPSFNINIEEIDMNELFYQLTTGLDGMNITHSDGMKTRLFINREQDGWDLSATFMPGNKAWTRKIIGSFN